MYVLQAFPSSAKNRADRLWCRNSRCGCFLYNSFNVEPFELLPKKDRVLKWAFVRFLCLACPCVALTTVYRADEHGCAAFVVSQRPFAHQIYHTRMGHGHSFLLEEYMVRQGKRLGEELLVASPLFLSPVRASHAAPYRTATLTT